MLFKKRFWPGLADGSITLAFRRWKKPTVKVNGTLRSPGGLLAIEALDEVTVASITVEQARASGFDSKAELLRALANRTGTLYRIRFRPAGPDPRTALLSNATLSKTDIAEIDAALQRSDDRNQAGPWTLRILRLIERHPDVRSGDLAPELELPVPEFKTRVRRLKKLGLTESQKVGYRLSPRGVAYLAGTRRRD